jgi:hypothetical protein
MLQLSLTSSMPGVDTVPHGSGRILAFGVSFPRSVSLLVLATYQLVRALTEVGVIRCFLWGDVLSVATFDEASCALRVDEFLVRELSIC